MHILIGLAAILALLYFWLAGNWFARLLVFLMLAALAIVGIADKQPDHEIIALIVAATMWPVASIPTYYWRQRMATLHRAGLSPHGGGISRF